MWCDYVGAIVCGHKKIPLCITLVQKIRPWIKITAAVLTTDLHTSVLNAKISDSVHLAGRRKAFEIII